MQRGPDRPAAYRLKFETLFFTDLSTYGGAVSANWGDYTRPLEQDVLGEVPPGECVGDEITWDRLDRDGQPAPADGYLVPLPWRRWRGSPFGWVSSSVQRPAP